MGKKKVSAKAKIRTVSWREERKARRKAIDELRNLTDDQLLRFGKAIRDDMLAGCRTGKQDDPQFWKTIRFNGDWELESAGCVCCSFGGGPRSNTFEGLIREMEK